MSTSSSATGIIVSARGRIRASENTDLRHLRQLDEKSAWSPRLIVEPDCTPEPEPEE